MNEKSYPFAVSRHDFRYEFVSVSEEKEVRKVVVLTQTEHEKMFTIALLDLLENGELSDETVSDNGDLVKVLATVYQIMMDFTKKRRPCVLIFKGSTLSRQRLYRIILNRQFSNLSKNWEIFGGSDDTIYIFRPDKIFDLYLMKRK